MKRNILARRAASAALAACMMFSLSAPALAASTDALLQQSTAAKSAVSVLDMQNDISESVTTMDLRNGSIIVSVENGQQYAEQKNIKQQISDLVVTTNNDETANTLTIEGGTTGAKVTLSNVKIETTSNAAVSVSGKVELVIEGTNILHSGWGHAGVEKADDNGTLTISGSGTLEAYGGYWGAGIGSGSEKGCSNIVIESGTITAKGGDLGAGIGGGQLAAGQNITIRDGNVTAIPGREAAGIGGGSRGDGKNITIEGGTVYAESGGGNGPAAAIGGGRWTGEGENIKITGGNVTLKTVDDDDIYIGNGQEEAEIDTSILLGTITKLDMHGVQVGNKIVQDFGIEVSEQPVTSENYKNLWKGYIVYDPKYKTLTAKDRIPQGVVKIRAPETDVFLNGGMQRGTLTIGQVEKKTVVGAHDVTVKHDQYAAVYGDVNINCTGKVDIRSDENMAVNGSLNIYNSSEVTLSAGNSVVTGSANITSDGDVTIESTDGRAAKNLTINKAEDVTISISDAERAVSEETKITASGTVTLKNKAPGGHVGTVTFKQADGKKYVYYTSEAEDAKLIDPRIHPLPDTVESSYLRIEPRETYYSITVANGTAQVGDDTTGQITTAFEGETVTVKAKAPTDEDAAKGVKFHHWKVEEGNTAFTLTDGKLGSKEEAGTEEISFDMPKGDVKLTAVYSIPASVLRSTVTVEGGTAKSTLGEGSDIPAEIGTTVEITATPYDAEKYPGMEFVEWEIKYPDSFYEKFPGGIPENLQLKLDNAKSATTTFKMPVYPVKLIAHWSASPVAGPDEPIDEDFGVEPAPMDTTGGAIAGVAIGGAAVWGGYEIATRIILNDLLPEGAAIPANRGQLALLVWNTAGRPEPAAQPAFADVADPDMAKAAQWCTEQGTMAAKGDRFEPEGWTPKFKVIEVWNKAFPKQ